MRYFILILFLIASLTGCKSQEKKSSPSSQAIAEYIFRQENQKELVLSPPVPNDSPIYPWGKESESTFLPLTQEYFCCKGRMVNPPKIISEGGKEINRYYDCGGVEKHSLPLRDGKEFIYPVLIEILNGIQEKTQKRVIITSGHRCPTHNAWVDPSPKNTSSKHVIGAEVDFYVDGMENQPDELINLIIDFYTTHPRYKEKKEYCTFLRYEKETTTSTKPYYNKEIFIKKFLPYEGRNQDNMHPYPYVSIQVRYDKDRNLPVTYTWEQAENYLRK